MKSLKFTFKNEAIWIVIFAIAPMAIGLLALLFVYFVRR